MPFNGIKDARDRADLLAFLKEADAAGAAPQRNAQAPMGGMGVDDGRRSRPQPEAP